MKEVKSEVPFPPFAYKIIVIFTDSLIESADSLAKQGYLRNNHGIDDTTGGFTVRMPNQSYTFVVLKFKAPLDVIQHECYHALCNMFRWIGASHEEELFAYLSGYLLKYVTHDQKKAKKELKTLDKSSKL